MVAARRSGAAKGRPGTKQPTDMAAGPPEGAAAIRRWIAAVKPEHRTIVKKVDALIRKTVPGVRFAVKWRQPFYGVEGKGWIVAVNSYTDYVSLTFFAGTSLKPVPPLGEHRNGRRVKIRDVGEVDEKQLRSWIQQAAAIPGWGKV